MKKKDGREWWWCARYEEATCYNEFGWNHQKLSAKLKKSNILRLKLRKTSENNLLILLFGLVNHEKIYWGRDCIDDRETQIGCEQKVYNGSEIELCVCRGEGCNKEMGDVSTSTAKPTTTHKGIKHFLNAHF